MAVLLEADANQFSKLQRDYGDTAVCIEGRVTDLDAELAKTGISQNPDFGVIDIDGQDYWMWLDLEEYRPRVMLVEIYPPDRKQPFPKRGANGGQAGLDAIESLGISKDYVLVATTYCNALFVAKEELMDVRY